MSLTNPDVILFDINGNPYGVSGSMLLPSGAIGQLIAGVDSSNLVQYVKVTSGSVQVTGSVATTVTFPSSLQTFTSAPQGVTGSVNVYTQGAQNVTGSVAVYTQGPQAVTGSVNVYTSGPQAVTGSVQSGSVATAPIFPIIDGGLDTSNTVRPILTDPQGRLTNPTTGSNVTSIAASVSNQTALFPNNQRVGAIFFNEGNGTAYLKFGITATLTNYTLKMGTQAYYELPYTYQGRIDVIFDKAVGNLRITELT